ncbi:MAG TPA: pirin family protein [Methanomassiliicoccales archaeon]|nr:pirin family protein [Methanomassiliicoccales archaeon]
MARHRAVLRVQRGLPTMEGAGVHLFRAFGHSETALLDPFLMLDHFRSSDPKDYMEGFPMHPHRGIETVTYVLSGRIEHQDSIGNKGVIGPGDLQWMTAGSGIMHQEMPRRTEGQLNGFQLWVNLPRAHKMIPPRYRDVKSGAIPTVRPEEGAEVKVIAGSLDGVKGPVKDLVVEVELFDVHLSGDADVSIPVRERDNAFAYVFEGTGHFEEGSRHVLEDHELAIFEKGEEVWAKAGRGGCRFLFAHGEPLHESIAWGGPIVMNTREELDQAFEELERGTFIR